MCGVAGIIDKKNKLNSQRREYIVRGMLGLMKHRGGDSVGVRSNENMTMGHTRLSIVDSTHQADQPFFNDESTLSFNGEVYNHQMLRKKFLKDIKISSYSDTATLFALLNKLPLKKVFEEIQGMFSLSYFNRRMNVLSIGVDRHSIKPLYYINTPDYFAWASEIKAFANIPKFKFQLEDKCLGEYLVFRYIAGESTLFKNVYKIEPGEYLTYSLGKKSLKKFRYYDLSKRKNLEPFSEKSLKNSIKDHLMGDVVAGVQLSGGIDSSLVALFAQKNSKAKLHTFSIGLREDGWNEFNFSDFVARKLKTHHHKIIFSKKDFAKLLSKLTYHLDEPIVHPNTIPMFLLAKEARKYTKVLLTGEGADEVFYGYNRYFFSRKDRESIIYSNSFNDHNYVCKILKNRRFKLSRRNKIVKSISRLALDKRLTIYDIDTYLPHVLLRQDKAGMAANVENRVPFLYQPIVESGFNSLNRMGEYGGKNQIKKIALKYFPKNMILRRKCGFGLPISEWLCDKDALMPVVSRITNHPMIKKHFYVREIDKLVSDHLNKKDNYSSILFTLICLTAWHDVFIKMPKSRRSWWRNSKSRGCS